MVRAQGRGHKKHAKGFGSFFRWRGTWIRQQLRPLGWQQASGPEVQLPPAFAQTRKDCTYWGPKPLAGHKASSGRLWDQHLLWPLDHWTPASFQKPLPRSWRRVPPKTQKHSAYSWAHNLRRTKRFCFPCANKGLQVNAHAQRSNFKHLKTWKRLCHSCCYNRDLAFFVGKCVCVSARDGRFLLSDQT